MPLKTETILSALMVLVMAGSAVWGHFVLPDVPIAIHYDFHGKADGFAPRDQALALVPGLAFCLHFALFWAVPALRKDGDLLRRSAIAYGATTLATLGLLTAVQITLILVAAGAPVSPVTVTTIGGGLVLIITGNYLPKARRNHFIGIRTPWTLADERVWDRTHRFGGPLLMLGGAVMIASVLLVPPALLGYAVLAGWALPLIVILAYSWRISRALRN